MNDNGEYVAILKLAVTYSAAASRRNAREVAEVFTANGKLCGVAVLVGQGNKDIVGAKAIEGFFAPVFDTLEFVHHTSQVVDVNIEQDKGRCTTMIVEWARPKGGKLMLVIGEYADELERGPAGWKFASRTLKTKSFSFVAEMPMT